MMNDFKILPDDPKLTAYALGELEGDERAAFAAALRNNPAAQAAVEEIRATVAQLEMALAVEPTTPVEPVRQLDPYPRKKKATLLRFPKIYYITGGLAAACVALIIALDRPEVARTSKAKQYVEMPLSAVEKPADVALPSTEAHALSGESIETAPAVATSEVKGDADATEGGMFDFKASGLLEESKKAVATTTGDSPAIAFDTTVVPSASGIENRALKQRVEKMIKQRAALAKAKAEANAREEKFVVNMVATAPAPVEAPVALSAVTVRAAQDAYATSMAVARESARTQFSNTSSAGLVNASLGYEGGNGTAAANTETYGFRVENDFLAAAENPLSTFSADVDTGSYSNVRRFLLSGKMPPPDAVRIEEMLNYFPYHYADPAEKDRDGSVAPPFMATMEVADAPWKEGHRLVRIGLKARDVATTRRGAANLVFLLDVSGSMNQPNKLPLVKESLRLLLARLRPDDRVAIVTYAGASGLALPSTLVSKAHDIATAIDELRPGGSTNGAMGIQLAYDIAKANFVAGGINRVILCTDGDFNVGVTSEGGLVRLITEKAKTKVFLTVLGFGMGNYKDATLQQLADAGNGNYGYVDTRREAEKLLVNQVSGTLLTVAKDVKLQVEFNPAKVASYRLIGYEKRMLKKEDFNNDAVDAGEIGAGHAVTALYEIVPIGGAVTTSRKVDELRYASFGGVSATMRTTKDVTRSPDDLLTLKVRYKEPADDVSKRLEFPLIDRGTRFAEASGDFKFAAAIAGFGMVLRDSPHKGFATLASVRGWAEAGAVSDVGGYRAEFVDLVRRAEALQ